MQSPWRAHIRHRTTCGLKRVYLVSIIGVCLLLVVAIVPSVILTRPRSSTNPTVQWSDITTSRGDHLPDFSYCGYHASEIPLPSDQSQPVTILNPQAGDQTARIQRALNTTAAAGGGVVALSSGTFAVSPGLNIPSGVVLRGAGLGLTLLTLSQLEEVPLITIGRNPGTVHPSTVANVVDQFIPIGASQLTVDNSTAFQAGQAVFVQRQVTAEWVRANGMDDLVLDGASETWIAVGTIIRQPRKIEAIQQNVISFTIPLTDALDAKYMQPTLVAYNPPNSSTEMGIEDLSIKLSPTCSGTNLNSTTCNAAAISFESWTVNSWARNLQLSGFNSFIEVQENSSQITIQNITMLRDANSTGVALPTDITIMGSQLLVADSQQAGLPTAESFAVMTESLTPGPNAVLRHSTPSNLQMLEPHQRWAHGLLIEDTAAPVHLINRATNGTGHGWAINAGVGWNLRGYSIVQSPPLGVNWCIGCSGTIDKRSNGTFVYSGKQVEPRSLFGYQLQSRMNGTGNSG